MPIIIIALNQKDHPVKKTNIFVPAIKLTTRNVAKINQFFDRLSYKLKYGQPENAAIGMDQKVVKFTVRDFDPLKLEGKVLEEWQSLPIEVCSQDK